MRPLKLITGALGSVLVMTTVGLTQLGAGATERPTEADPAASTVLGHCWGGSGEMSVRVHPAAPDGRYRVDVTGHRMVEGTRWVVAVPGERDQREFHRRSIDGGWSVSLRLDSAQEVGALVVADQLPFERHHGCLVMNIPFDRTVIGATFCTPRRFIFTTTGPRHGATVVATSIWDQVGDARWAMHVAASSGPRRHSVRFDDMTNHRGVLRSRIELRGLLHPRVRVDGTRHDGPHCKIAVDPSNVASADMARKTHAQYTDDAFRRLVRLN